MINEHVNVKDFFYDLMRRGDGQIFYAASLLCIIFLGLNVAIKLEFINNNLGVKDKWIAAWALMPVILLMVHIRMRQIFKADNVFMVYLHGLIQFGIVFTILLKNGGVF